MKSWNETKKIAAETDKLSCEISPLFILRVAKEVVYEKECMV